MIQVDSLRYDYLTKVNPPFLWELGCQGCLRTLLPTFGFEPDASYIAGLFPDEANGGAQFWYDPENSPFGFLGSWLRIGNLLPDFPDRVFRRIIKSCLKKKCFSPTFTTAKIPFHLLKYFNFPMRVRMDGDKFVKSQSLFDILRANERTWLFHGAPCNKVDIQSVVQRVEQDLHPPLSFAFLHVGDLDHVGHKDGPDSTDRRAIQKEVLRGVEAICGIAHKRFSQVHIVIMGDHGMMTVSRHLDIWNKLKRLPLKLEKDYLVFLDSTMARFWFFSDKAEKIIVDMLSDLDSGYILNQAEKDKYHLNYSHNKFGDIFFLVDPGTLIFPNFYQNKKPVKGMHGYAPETLEQQSALFIHSPKIKKSRRIEKPVDMRRVFPTVLDLMDLPVPVGTTLKSLL